jgi:hypothetical protein
LTAYIVYGIVHGMKANRNERYTMRRYHVSLVSPVAASAVTASAVMPYGTRSINRGTDGRPGIAGTASAVADRRRRDAVPVAVREIWTATGTRTARAARLAYDLDSPRAQARLGIITLSAVRTLTAEEEPID